MRRVVCSAIAVVGLIIGGPQVAAAAAPNPAPSASASRGTPVCTITDERLIELSGMVATDDGYIVINDSSDEPSRNKIFFLDGRCRVRDIQSYSGNGPRDTEDLGLSPDGRTLYIADIGDNDRVRDTVALWTMPADGSAAPVINRLTYPDGRHDAEALLFNRDGTPLIVTREAGKSGIYSPSRPLEPRTTQGVPLVKRGELRWPKTTTTNQFLGPLAQLVITGGATAPNGDKVVLRTYADAFEWDVPGGDVVAAVTDNRPRATALPGEPRGEAIAYSSDGASFLTVSEVADQPPGTRPEIRRYTPSGQVAVEPQGPGAPHGDTRSWFAKLSLQDLTYLIVGVGLVGVLLLAAGVYGIVRSRRAATTDDGDDHVGRRGDGDAVPRVPVNDAIGSHDGFDNPDVPGSDRYSPTRPPSGAVGRAGTVYGGGPLPGGVYGEQPPRGGAYGSARGGAVYGAGSTGGDYGGPSGGGPGSASGR